MGGTSYHINYTLTVQSPAKILYRGCPDDESRNLGTAFLQASLPNIYLRKCRPRPRGVLRLRCVSISPTTCRTRACCSSNKENQHIIVPVKCRSHQSDAAIGARDVVVFVEVSRGSPGAVLGEGAEHLKIFQVRVLQSMSYREFQ